MWRSLVLSVARPIVNAVLLMAVNRAKLRLTDSDSLSEAEKVLANEVIDNLLLEIQNDLNNKPQA